MPFTEPVSSMSGRNSRSSNVSAMTGASRSIRGGPPKGPPTFNDTLSSAAVLGMLKTSTDTGDIGALSFNSSRVPALPKAAHQRKGHMQRLSGLSHHPMAEPSSHHHYAPSQTSRISDSTSFVRRGSLTSMQSMPPSMPTMAGKVSLQVPPPTFDRRDSRSYSLTSAPATQSLPRQRSSTSLKSAGHQPRHGPHLRPRHIPPVPENRPPYVYPTRLKRSGYRSPLPALSDVYPQAPSMPAPPLHSQQAPPMSYASRRLPVPMQRPQPYTYNSDYGSYAPDVYQADVRPPPRAMEASPGVGYESDQFAYRAGPIRSERSVPAPHMPYPSRNPAPHSGQYGMPRQQYHGPQQYAAQQYGPPRPGYPACAPAQHGSHRATAYRGPPPSSTIAPVALSMFHNAARMARQLPQRTDTPLTDLSPPSSDPPSSGTAPTSSSPPTPKDMSTSQVAVDPLFIDPAFTDLPDSSSEPVLTAKYFEYADGLEHAVEETEVEVHHPSVPPTGFVQRVKAMLESKAAIDAAAREVEREKAARHFGSPTRDYMDVDVSEIHELAANETPRFTVIEEFEAPVELPASPVKVAELSNSPAQPKQRLTRELVKAELAPSDTLHDSYSQADNSGATDVDARVEHKQYVGKQAGEQPQAGLEESHSRTSIRQPDSRSACITQASVEATGISGIDYALRFSVPIDTTTSTEETQSKDHFPLDADTITLQHQRSKEKVTQLGPLQVRKLEQRPEVSLDVEQPVSPLLSDDNVERVSAVSPLQTKTLGIGETMRLGASTTQEGTTTEIDQSMPASSTEDSQPPPTPRTPRTYSKSVQLPPASATPTETPSSHRYSLPPDLSTVGDSTVNTASEMITDVAVRFSMPTTTITIGKPQIITVPPSSSPEKQAPQPKANPHRLEPRSARRGSVSFADHVAPLNVKKSGPSQDTPWSAMPNSGRAKSILRRTSPLSERPESSRTPTEGTINLRFQGTNGLSSKTGSTHLPRLKEESVEDMSVNERLEVEDSTTDSNQFPLPVRIAAVKAMQERRLHESAEKARARRAARQHNRPLVEIRDLPSLNFSRMDLIDKLNEALETRPSKSMEIVRRRDFSDIYCPSPQRPQSTEPIRERYASFFSKPEDFSFFEDPEDEQDKESQSSAERPIPVVEVQESTKIEGENEPASRPLSPEDLLNVATEVNRLSIPSVSGLSARLTNLLPSLRNLHLDSVIATDEDVEHTIDDIHHLGHGGESRPDTMLSSRTSAGFRTLAERAEDIVLNGTHDSIIPPGRLLLTDKDLPPLPESASADKVSAVNTVESKQSYLSGSVSAPSDLGKDLARPSSALVRHKSPTTEDEVRELLPPEMNPITRGKRSLVISSASRPWNQDENYPWAGTEVPIDLTVPSEAHTRDSLTTEVRRNSKSVDLSTSGEPTDTTKGIDIGSITTDLDRTASITTEQATGVHRAHARKQSKHSLIGSLSRKIGLGSRHNGKDVTHNLPSPPPMSDESVPHKPGDRYPTSALTAPLAFNLDEVRSFFSDNSSDKQRNGAFRKRLTGFKSKGKTVRVEPGRGASLDDDTAYDAGSLNADRLGAASSAQTFDGVGMGKTEFHIKRFGEKLRHLLAKGGELIRSLSTRSRAAKAERLHDEWLSDSLYSGV